MPISHLVQYFVSGNLPESKLLGLNSNYTFQSNNTSIQIHSSNTNNNTTHFVNNFCHFDLEHF